MRKRGVKVVQGAGETPAWLKTQDELRRGYAALIAAGTWSYRTLAETAELSGGQTDLHKKLNRDGYIGPNEQIRMSRVLHLIETGRLETVEVLANRGIWVSSKVIAQRCEPPDEPAKPVFRATVGYKGIKLHIGREKRYSEEELWQWKKSTPRK